MKIPSSIGSALANLVNTVEKAGEGLVAKGVKKGEKFAHKEVKSVGTWAEHLADGFVEKGGKKGEKFVDGLISEGLHAAEDLPLVGGLIKAFEPAIEQFADKAIEGLFNKGEGWVDGLIGKGVDAAESAADGLINSVGNGAESWMDGELVKLGSLFGLRA
jgi:hypothetical protein